MTPAAENHTSGVVEASSRRGASENALLLSVATIAARLSAFALAIVMGRELGPSGYGLYGYAVAIVTVLDPIADLGLTPYLTREVARDRARGETLLDRLLRARLLASTAVAAAVAVLALATGASTETFLVIVIVVASGLIDGLSLVLFGYFVGRERMALEAGLTAATALARSAGATAIVAATGRLAPAVTWMLLAGVLQLGWAWARTRQQRHGVGAQPPAIPWRTVLSLGLTTVAVMVYLRADTVLVGWLANHREVGFYAAAYTLLLGLQIVPHMIGRALTPVFARTWAAGQRDAFVAGWQNGTRAVLVITLPVSLAVSILAGPVIVGFFGDGFGPAADALAILVWSSPLAALNNLAFAALRGAQRDRLLTTASIAGALSNVALNVWAIDAYGIEGAAAVTIATEGGILAAQAGPAVARGLLPFPRLLYLRLALSLAAVAATAAALRDQPMALSLGASLAVGAVSLPALGVVRPEELRAMRALAGRRAL